MTAVVVGSPVLAAGMVDQLSLDSLPCQGFFLLSLLNFAPTPDNHVFQGTAIAGLVETLIAAPGAVVARLKTLEGTEAPVPHEEPVLSNKDAHLTDLCPTMLIPSMI